jgi:uncharacterized membrane protein
VRIQKDQIIDLVVLVTIYSFLLYYFKPNLILLNTTTSGGDTPSHHYLAYYLKNYLLPRFRITGWSPDWYAGFPFLTFYFPLSYLLIVFISYFLPFVIAFKIVSIMGVFLLPVCTYFSLKCMKFQFPIPTIASILSLYFLFSESFTFYGANIASTLAGEFSYGISFSLMVLLTGAFYKGLKEKKDLIKNSLLFSLVTFSHLYTAGIFLLSSLFFLRDWKRNLKYLFLFFFIGFSLVAFWLLPFILKAEYMSNMGWIQDRRIHNLYKKPFNSFLPLSILAIIIAFVKKDERIFYFLAFVLISLLFFFLLPNGHFFNCRYLPFYYFYSLLMSSYAMGKAIQFISSEKIFISLLIFVFLLFSLRYISSSLNFLPFWIKWNYEGFESKQNWQTLYELLNYIKGLPYGRMMHEYSPLHDSFGSPRTLESIPYFSGKPVMEGLLIESAVVAPYHFWMQAQLSERPSCPISYVGCSPLNISKGYEYLKLFGVKYFIASSEKVKKELEKNSNFKLLKEIKDFRIYEVNGSGNIVEIPKYKPVFAERKNWKELSLQWFKSEFTDVPIIFSDEKAENMIEKLGDIKRVQLNANCYVQENVSNEEIKIKTNCISVPLLIKVPYFPNWKVEGAEKIYLVSPAFMLVFPVSENVRIYYGTDLIDTLGMIISFCGVILLIKICLRNLKNMKS